MNEARAKIGAPDLRAWFLLLGCVALWVLYWSFYCLEPGAHYHWCQGEDKLVETLTFAGFAGACALYALCLRHWRGMTRRQRGWIAGLALFHFACAGEEISWGQRVLGFETPEAVARVNEQREFNFHNLSLRRVHPKDYVSLFMKTCGLALPLVLWRRLRDPAHPLRRYLPPVTVAPVFVWAEFVNGVERPFRSWLAAQLGDEALAVVRTQTEELIEMYWGLGCLAAAAFLFAAWRRRAARG